MVMGAVLAGAAAPSARGTGDESCPWDVDRSGAADISDLLIVLGDWGSDGSGSGADITGDGVVDIADLLALLANWGACPPADAPRLFGHYSGTALVLDSEFFPPGSYPAEVAIGQTASGVVGFINIIFDPGDLLGGTFTHAFAGPTPPGVPLQLKYSDRMCGGGDPIDLCYPHNQQGFTQYSFRGSASVRGDELTLAKPAILPGLPYAATQPFESATLTRTPGEPRESFDGFYGNLEYIWMGTVLFALPLPLFGTSQVLIAGGEIIDWVNNGIDIPLAGQDPGPVISAWCFDDASGRGWMNQQGEWTYHWILDPGGAGLAVIVTFANFNLPDCDNLQDDPLSGEGLDLVHLNLAGMMFELR